MTGEIMRAVLEDSCLWSRPAWFGDHQFVIAPAAVGGVVRFTMSGSITTRPNSYFLCTSISVNACDVSLQNNLWQPYSLIFPFNLRKSSSGQSISFNSAGQNPPPASLLTTATVSPCSLTEYLYFKPQESVDWSLDFNVQAPPGVPGAGNFITADVLLQGIEYFMPTGAANGQAA